MSTDLLLVHCPHCDQQEVWDADETYRRLRALQMMRRAEEMDPELFYELARHAAEQLRCDQCGHVGLAIGPSEGRPVDEWGEERPCERCGQPIPAERLEFLPDATLCVSCQQVDESPGGADEPEYCPRCGAVLQLKTSGQGISRYVRWCRDCRWQG